MARQRFIHPDFWTDPSIGQLTPIERLFFIGCFSNADDEGRLLGNPAFLRSTIFPYDDIGIEEITAIRDKVVATCRNLVLYEVKGVEYLAFRKWATYQKPKYPKASKLPAPPSPDDRKREDTRPGQASPIEEPDLKKEGGDIGERLPQNGGKPSEELEKGLLPGLGRDRDGYGMGRDRVGLGGDTGEPSPPPSPPPLPPDATPMERAILHELKAVPGYPFDYTKDLEYVRVLLPDFPDLDILDEVKKWSVYKRDRPLAKKSNPRLQFRNWLEKAREFAKERSAKCGRGDQVRTDPPPAGKYDDLVIRDPADLPGA